MNRPSHLGHFLRSLVDQQYHHVDIRMIRCDSGGHLLQQNRLSRTRRRHDQSALAEADRRQQIDDSHRGRAIVGFESHAVGGADGDQVVERCRLDPIRGRSSIDRGDVDELCVLLPLVASGSLLGSADKLTTAQPILLNRPGRDSDIVGSDGVVAFCGSKKPVVSAVEVKRSFDFERSFFHSSRCPWPLKARLIPPAAAGGHQE